MKMRVRVEPLAAEEAEGAMQWYESRRTGLGADFLIELERGLAEIVRAPRAWPTSRDDERARRFLLRRFPFAIVYVARDEEIVVIAVAHLHRRPGYWKERT